MSPPSKQHVERTENTAETELGVKAKDTDSQDRYHTVQHAESEYEEVDDVR